MSKVFDRDMIKEVFKDHAAHLKVLDEDTQTLTWKKDGTRAYQIDFVFFKNTLFVTGDLRSAVFDTTWRTSWNCQDGWRIELGYFADKLNTITNGKYEWDSDAAVNELMSFYRDDFEELTDEEFNQMFEYIKFSSIGSKRKFENEDIPYKELVSECCLFQMCLVLFYVQDTSSQEEFVYILNSDSEFDDFNDFWEWGYKCGQVLNEDIEIYLVALQMAYDQLSKSKGE